MKARRSLLLSGAVACFFGNPLLGATIQSDESHQDIVLATNINNPAIPIPAGDQPTLGYFVFCEGTALQDQSACATVGQVQVQVSDVFQFGARQVTVDNVVHTEYFLSMLSDKGPETEPTEKVIDPPIFTCPPGGNCIFIPEPGISIPGTSGGPGTDTGAVERFRYVPQPSPDGVAPAQPGWVQNDPTRAYVLISDVPEPTTVGLCSIGIAALIALTGLRRRITP
jgi:hypothetical protein